MVKHKKPSPEKMREMEYAAECLTDPHRARCKNCGEILDDTVKWVTKEYAVTQYYAWDGERYVLEEEETEELTDVVDDEGHRCSKCHNPVEGIEED